MTDDRREDRTDLVIQRREEHWMLVNEIPRPGECNRDFPTLGWSSLKRLVCERDRWICQTCGRDLLERDEMTELGHLHNRMTGGSDHPSNLITQCYDCNRDWMPVFDSTTEALDFVEQLPFFKRTMMRLVDSVNRALREALKQQSHHQYMDQLEDEERKRVMRMIYSNCVLDHFPADGLVTPELLERTLAQLLPGENLTGTPGQPSKKIGGRRQDHGRQKPMPATT